jgi:hypothetical protein
MASLKQVSSVPSKIKIVLYFLFIFVWYHALQFIESKNLPHDLGNKLQNHFEFQYRKALKNQASALIDLPRYNKNMHWRVNAIRFSFYI